MNQWLFEKIINYLSQHEGCETIPDEQEAQGHVIRTIVQDSFGFRYEIRVKTLGRLQGLGDLNLKTGSFMSRIGDLDV